MKKTPGYDRNGGSFITNSHNIVSVVMRLPRGLSVLTCVLLLFAMATAGCSRSVRDDAKPVAQFGSATADQIAQIYEAAQEDVTDTFELNQFFAAYADPNATVTLSDNDKQLLSLMQDTNRALASRVRLAKAMKRAYDSYARLSDYNNAAEMQKSVSDFSDALNSAATLALPGTNPGASAVGTTASGILKDVAREVGTLRQNRALLREGKKLIPILERLQTVFDAERKLLPAEAAFPAVNPDGTPQVDAQGQPVMILVRGIAGERIQAYKRVYQTLVTKEAVVSQAVLDRFLAKSNLRWPDPNKPFTEPGIKAGVVRLIEVEAYQRGRASDLAGEEVSDAFGQLIVLHRQLDAKKSLSLQQALEQSAVAQLWLAELKKKDIPTDSLIELIQAVQQVKGAQP